MIENKIIQIQFFSGLALAIFAANLMFFEIGSLSIRIIFLILGISLIATSKKNKKTRSLIQN